jgi:hypothetical protein
MNYYTAVTVDQAIAASELTLNSAIDEVTADLSNNYYTATSTDQAISAQTSSLQTSINDNTSEISSTINSVNGVRAQYGVRINNNGAISGFGLISNMADGGATSDFFVDADTFRIGSSYSTGSYISPFQVSGGNTYIRDAFIQNAAVDTLKIQGNAVTVTTVSTRSDGVSGAGGTHYVHGGSIYMDNAGYILITWSGAHGYSGVDFSVGYAHSLSLRINGSTVWSRSGQAINDYPSISYGQYVGAGTATIAIYWSGEGSQITLGSRALTLQGAKR